MLTRESMLNQRDQQFATILDMSNKIENAEEKKKMEDELKKLEEIILRLDMTNDLDSRRSDKRIRCAYWNLFRIFESKHIRTILLAFIAGLIVALIPTLLYISSLNDNTPTFHFIPNAIAERKPVYLQILKTEEQVDNAKAYKIYSPDPIVIGDAVGYGATGLGIYRKKQISAPDMKLKTIAPQKDKQLNIGGYVWIPDAILTADPLPIQILYSYNDIETVKKDKTINYKEFLSIGSAVGCQKTVPCYILAKRGLDDRFIVKPFNYINPNN